MYKLLPLFLLLTAFAHGQNLSTEFEKSGGKSSPTYSAIIDWWKSLDKASPLVQMKEAGPTDAGFPLHLILVSSDRDFSLASIKSKKKTVILINNGIHPGEPDGIDASMLMVRDIATGKTSLPASVVLAIIPVYNIGGALNRSSNYRIDQNGPAEKGFRGNSQNLDLNRDFIKCDAKESLTLSRIFSTIDPDIFVDNHVSNGADYQHVMTLLTTQHNRLSPSMASFLNQQFEPALYGLMKQKGFDLVPYVNHFGETPDKGWNQFWDSPRYSSGYASIRNVFAFVPETHMLKPYPQRVAATRALMESFIEFARNNGEQIRSLRQQTAAAERTQKQFSLAWKWDPAFSAPITFKGYEAAYRPSAVSGQQRLYYDRNRPYEKQVPFFNRYRDTLSVDKPTAYLIPQGWWKVIERLQANGIRMHRLTRDSAIDVECYRIESYQSTPRPFEGHHLNTGTQVSVRRARIRFRKGDYLIPMDQPSNKFLIHTLEPQGEDSYFAWNFFDPILGQKEGFSDYVFEETAEAFLKANPDVARKLEERKASDSAFARNGRAQLNFIYLNSPYYEGAHLQYPVYRVR